MNRPSALELYRMNPRGFKRNAVHRFLGGDLFDPSDFIDWGGGDSMQTAMDSGAGGNFDFGEYTGDLPPQDFNPANIGTEFTVPGAQTDWSGEYPYQASNPDNGGFWSGLERAGQWMQKNPVPSMMGLGLGLGALQTYAASRTSKKNQQMQNDAIARREQRQALMDNPPPYSGMNIQPARRDFAETAAMNPLALRNYGAGPERRFFAARGGKPGALEQMRMIQGGGGGQSDTVPAMLSPTEYVIDADVVASLGDGNPQEGARKLDRFRENVRSHKRGASPAKIPPKARPVESYLRRAA